MNHLFLRTATVGYTTFMNLVCCQIDSAWENRNGNFKRVRELLAKAMVPPGSLILLPEMFATGFSMNVDAIAEPENGPTQQFLAELAVKYRSTLIGGMVRKTPHLADKGHNRAVAVSPTGKVLADYAKIHPFLGPEAAHYAGGKQVLTFPWELGAGEILTVTPAVCYDLRFPELFRHATLKGAQVLAIIANWPAPRIHHWVTLLQARAIENQAYVAACNRVGNDPQHAYPGRSLIISPMGEILADAGAGESVISAPVDPAGLRAWREKFPILGDIRRGQFFS